MSDPTPVLESLFETVLKKPARGLVLTKLQGEASYRIYYRAALPTGETFIVMKMPAGKASASEEISNLKESPQEPPFLAVGRFLASRGLPVPKVLHYEAAEGLILLEDLGDETFEKRLASVPPSEWGAWYRKAIDLLVEFQKKTAGGPSDSLAHRRSFDATLLNWEFDHFLEYGIEVRLGVKLSGAERDALHRHTEAITRTLVAAPQILVHRDFQSRNLMIQKDGLKLLDFQDALMGPLPYDLVALLRDSYVSLPPDLLRDLVAYYVRRKNEDGAGLETGTFQRLFDLMTIQRKLKDAGRFVYIDKVKGNPSFLKHIPSSLAYVRAAFERCDDQHPLFDLLKAHVPEFRP